jgi:Adenylate and Guanylate cyclase catalytic domain
VDPMFHLSHRLRSKLRSPLGRKCAGQANLDLYSASQCDTPMAAKMTPLELVDLLNEVFQCFDGLVEKYDLEKIKTIGDCYMVASGVPRARPDHATALVDRALDMKCNNAASLH